MDANLSSEAVLKSLSYVSAARGIYLSHISGSRPPSCVCPLTYAARKHHVSLFNTSVLFLAVKFVLVAARRKLSWGEMRLGWISAVLYTLGVFLTGHSHGHTGIPKQGVPESWYRLSIQDIQDLKPALEETLWVLELLPLPYLSS